MRERQHMPDSGNPLETTLVVKNYVAVLAKNEGLETLRQINAVLCGDDKQRIDGFSFTSEEVAAFKYAPLVSCDVERSFSKYRAVFRDNRRAFHAETLKKHLIIYCNP
jgi:hypothetical protein